MNIVERIVEFILGLISKAILTAIIGGAMVFTLLVLSIFMPEQVKGAFDILKGLIPG